MRKKDQLKTVEKLEETIRSLAARNGELERTIGDLEEKLFRCPITGLYNEAFFRRYIRGAVDISLDVQADGALLFISIDRFSGVNLRHGSEGANETLKKFASALPNSVTPDAVLFRLSGALFACYLAWADKGLGAAIAENIRSTTAASEIYLEPITVSIGVVNMSEVMDQSDEDRQRLVERLSDRAKRRLDIARREGMNTVRADEDFDALELARKDVVLVDQDPFRIQLFSSMLKNSGFAVREETNGADALESIQKKHPALVIADLYIPGLDAFALREKMREQSETARVPYLVITERKSPDIAERAYAAGVTLLLQRPVLIEELIGLAKNLTEASDRHAG